MCTKDKIIKRKIIFLLISLLVFAVGAEAQNPSYKLYLTNEAQVSPTEYEFEVYLLRTGATPLEMATLQFGLGFDTSILNGGTPTASIVSGTSDFGPNFEPTNVQIGGPVYIVNSVNYRYFNCAARSAPGAGNGLFISNVFTNCASPGMRVARFKLTNSVPFANNSSCKHIWASAVGSGRTNTQVNAYVNSFNTNISTGVQLTSNLNYNETGTCIQNILLNPLTPCAVFIATSSTTESCFGSSDATLTVTLSGTGSSASGTYSIDGGSFVSYSSNPFNVTGLSAGTHTIDILTSTPCTVAPRTFLINGPTNPSTSTETETACDSYTWAANGITYTSTGSYSFVGTLGGCTHTYNLNLTINNSTNTTVSRNECDSYTWPVNGMTYTSSGTYTFSGVNGSGCPLNSTLILTISSVVVTATPGAAIACFGGSTSVVVSATGGTSPYSGTGTFTQVAGTTIYNVMDVTGCIGTDQVILTQPTEINASFSTSPANCGVSDGTATVSPSGGSGSYTYLWSNGSTGITTNGLSSGTHSITITDNTGCSSQFNFNIGGAGGQPDPAGPISGPPGTCLNQSGIVYTIDPIANAQSYVWTLPTGVTGASSTNSITLNVGAAYAGGFICVAAFNSCGQGTQSCFNIPLLSRRPTQPGFISGDQNPCGPNVFTYSIPAIANALAYVWSVNGTGLSIQSGQGTRTIEVNIPNGFGQGSVSVKAQNCIGSTASRTLNLTGIPTHSNTLTGPDYVCAGTSGVAYSIGIVSGAGSSYTWSVSGDMSISSSSQGTCILNFGPSFSTGVLTVTTTGTCGSFTKSYTIRSKPLQPKKIFGPGTNLCEQSSVTYYIDPVESATTYQWSVPVGVNIISNAGTSITVDFTTSFRGTGYICVAAQNSCGRSIDRCYLVTSRPPAPSSITGNTNTCQTSVETYTSSTVAGATGYVWAVSGGPSINSGGTNASITYATAFSTFSVLSVSAENNCGIGSARKLGIHIDPGCRLAEKTESRMGTISISPNPGKGYVMLNYLSEQDAYSNLKFYDLLGNLIREEKISLSQGKNQHELNLGNLAKGVYFVSIETNGNKSGTVRLIME